MKRLTLALGALVWAFVGGAISAQAATFNVTRTDDPPPNGCLPSDCSLREAVIAANGPGDLSNTIFLPPGKYALNQSGADDPEHGDLDVTKSLTVKGNSAQNTIIDAAGLTNLSGVGDRIFDVQVPAIALTLVDLTLQNGNPSLAASPSGGAVLSDMGASLTLQNCVIQNNKADLGGGVFSSQGPLTIISSTLTQNQASTGTGIGGGIIIQSSTQAVIVNSTISGNNAILTGGGLSANSGGGGPNNLKILNSTITNNSSPGLGGGIEIEDATTTVQTQNSIVAGNNATADCDSDGAAVFTSLGFNIFGKVSVCGPALGTDKNDVSDAGLEPLANYGGETPTHLLKATSVALSNGDPTGCKDQNNAPLATDQRGQTRPASAACDSGSVELGTVNLSITKVADATQTDVGSVLVYTITATNSGPDVEFNASITDTLPSEVSFQAVTTQDPTDICSQNSGVVTCELGQLNSGDTAVITINVTVNANGGGTITNVVSIKGSEIDSDPANNNFSLDTKVFVSSGCALGSGGVSGFSWIAFAGFVLGLGLARLGLSRSSRET